MSEAVFVSAWDAGAPRRWIRQAAVFRASGDALAALNTPRGGAVALVVTTFLARLALARAMGLGIDESYMAANSRNLQLSYFDHPPVAWWLTWIGEQIGGAGNDVMIRLPFIALFAASTWLMFRLTEELFDDCAGLWAAAALNAAPVLGIAAGTWVLPDGPLLAALLGGTYCFVRATRQTSGGAWGHWGGAGLCFGVALCSKYTALPILAGLAAYLVTTPEGRVWLRRPQPYAAAAIALVALTPVILWNVEHHFASFRFQGGRAFGGKLHVFGPLATAAGEAVFFLPWLFIPLVILLWRAARTGPSDPRRWLFACLSGPSFVLFELVSLRSHVLFHWVAPALMMSLPLLGRAIGERRRASRHVRLAMLATAATVSAGACVVGSEVRYNWLPEVIENFALGDDPDIAAVDWTSLLPTVRAQQAADPSLVVAAVRWLDAGKVDFALRKEAQVICLGDDPREYGMTAPVEHFLGRDVLILAPRESLATIRRRFGRMFDALVELPPIIVRHAGRPAMLVPVFLGRRLHLQLDARA